MSIGICSPQKCNRIFDDALRYGIIRLSQVYINVYKVILAGNFDAEAEYERCFYNGNANGAKLRALKDMCENMLKPENDLPYLDADRQKNTEILLYGGGDLYNVRRWFMVFYGLSEKIQKEIDKYRRLEELMNRINLLTM